MRSNLKLAHCQLFPLFSLISFIHSQLELEFCVGWSKQNYSLEWGETLFQSELNKNVQFLCETKKKCKPFQGKPEMLCSCLASYGADDRKLCNYWGFFSKCPYFYLQFKRFFFFLAEAFWKEKPNFQAQRGFFCWFFFPLAFPPWNTFSLTVLKCSVLTFSYVDVGLSVLPETTEGIKTASLEPSVSP